jgi:hypothetical protein
MQTLLLAAYAHTYSACTSTSTMAQLSAKERRCIQQGVANHVEARAHIAQHMAAQQQAAGKDF